MIILIFSPQNVEGGLFTSNYTNYTIKTDPFDWNVKRRYSDFELLRNILCRIFPGHMVPPLPNKKMGKRRFELDFINKRMTFLQKFIGSILENEYFKSHEILFIFLSQNDPKTFENKMKDYSNYEAPKYVD